MSGRILKLARKDAKRHITNGGFEENITLSTPSKDLVVSVKGFVTKHFISYDESGNTINGKNAHVTVSESDLIELNYPHRNDKKEITLLNHIIKTTDSSGEVKTYSVKENYPDETLGLIVCILTDFIERKKNNPTSDF